MHACLKIPEIAALICAEGFHSGGEGRDAVLSLAQTCRMLYEPAANIIWHRIPSLKPLTTCLPADVWDDLFNNDDTVFRPLRPSHFSRMKAVARRVRAFGPTSEEIPTFYTDDLSLMAYRTLNLAVGHELLLPNVREATLVNIDLQVLTFAGLFTNKQITHLGVMYLISPLSKCARLQVFTFLNSIGSRFPLLKHLEVHITSGTQLSTHSPAMSEFLLSSEWENLSTLRIEGPVSSGVLQHLLKLPSLQNLNLKFSPLEHAILRNEEVGSNSQQLLFHNLEHVALGATHFPTLTDFLRRFLPQDSPLRAVHLLSYNATQSTPLQWKELCHGIYGRCRTDLLESVNISQMAGWDETGPTPIVPYSISLEHFSPLLSFLRLRFVEIVTCGSLRIDDSCVKQMATAWPNLVTLKVEGLNRNSLPPRVTLAGLATFAEHCPKVGHVYIEFDARGKPDLAATRRPRFGSSLNTLTVARSPITDPGFVAAYLTDIFPAIKVIYWDGPESGTEVDTSDNWEQVEQLIEVFAKVRSQEIARGRLTA